MWVYVTNLGTIVGIVGVSFSNIFEEAWKGWIALAIIVLFLIFVGWRVYLMTNRVLKQTHPHGYLPLSSIVKYTTSDGKNIEYEVVRHLQVKRPFLRHINHRFNWTGSKEPVVTSDIQTAGKPSNIPGSTAQEVKLIFPNTRIYNDVEVVHMKMLLDDSDELSLTHLSQKVESPIRLLTYRVELLHVNTKYHGESAKLYRENFQNGNAAAPEELQIIKFNPSTKSFDAKVPNPEPGYHYILAWPRPGVPAGKVTRRRVPKP